MGKNKEMLIQKIDKMILSAREEHDDIDDIVHDFEWIKDFINKNF